MVENQLFTNSVWLAFFPPCPHRYFLSFRSPCAHLSPFFSLSFPSFPTSPPTTVFHIYYVPGAKYSCMHSCPKRRKGTSGSACTPFSLWHRMTLGQSSNTLTIFIIFVSCIIDNCLFSKCEFYSILI